MLVYEQIVAIAKKMPEKIAIYGTGQVYSYGWLDQCSNRVACALLEQGVKQNELIALCFSRSVDYVVTLLAVHKIGCAFLPLNTDQPVSRINTIVELAGVKHVVKNIASIQFGQVKILDYASLFSQREVDESVLSLMKVDPETLAYVIFTSGSTGLPKGVKIKQASLASLVQQMRDVIGIDETDCLFAQAAFHFDMSIADIYWPLTSAAAIYLPTQDELRHPKKTIDLLNSENITLLQGTPSWYRYLFMAHWQPVKKYKILCGGEAFPFELKERLLGHATELWNMYGPTEATVWVSALKINNDDKQVSLGDPFPGTFFKVVEGELHIGGEQVADGYLGASPDQNKKFYLDADRALPWYKTGDAVREESGQLVFSGRIDRQVKINGLRVELGEIETIILADKHIDAAGVLMVQEPHPVLVVFVVSALAQPELEKVVLAQCENSLPAYMHVAQVLKIETMPLTSSNKTDYHQLKCLFEKAVLTHNKHLLEDTTVRKTEVVQGMRNIWQRYLRLGHLDGNRGFFDLGGTSLIAIQVMADIKKQYRLDAPLDLFLLNSFDEFSQAVLKINSSQHVEERFVVPLLPAKASSKKLFFVHGIGGGVLNYKKLAIQLGDADMYGIQCRGLDGVSPPINDIKKMAALYIDAIKAIQSEGPYYLLGGSMGGVVAFEMACQLQNRGDELASVVMFDSYPPGSYSTSNMFERIKNFLSIFNTISKNEKKDNASMMASDISQNLSSKLMKKSQSLLDFFYIKLSQWLNRPLGHAHRYDFIRDVHLKALQLYRPSEKFKGDVLYFKAGDDLHAQPGIEKGWETYLNGKLIVHVLSGSHDNLIENKALPAYLNQILFYLPSCSKKNARYF